MTNIVQVGAGYWGKNLLRNFSELGVLSALVEIKEELLGKLSTDFDVQVRKLDEVLADDAVSAISIATPAETHAEFAMQALDAGKHVYVEKPLSLKIEDAEALIEKADNKGLILMVGHLLQYHPIFIHLKKIVKDKKIGNVQYIYSNRLNLGKFRLEENVWWSFASHDLSMILSLAGEEPTKVTAQSASYVTPGIADWTTAQLKFPSGIQAHLNISWLNPVKEQLLVVIGESGMLVFEDSAAEWGKKLAYYRHSISRNEPAAPYPNKADVEYITVQPDEPLKMECQHFIDCIESGEQPRTNGQEGLRVLRVLSAGEASLAKFVRD